MNNYSEKFEKMRDAGNLASRTLDMLTEYIKAGIQTKKIDQLAYEFIKDNDGYSAPQFYRGFKKSLCTSLNHVVCHGIPSDRVLEDGDVINVDGHNYSELKKAFLKKHLKPKVIIAKTIKGKGISFMENKVEWHYKNPTNEELNKALKELNNA